ncbi:HET-domain-containing protein [Rhizopogon vinicolor AM-OR11-026]|uniref:HET-domain-containing protein n=1 Tax=Rhizopogon vinicolor AM-OR11-026 TaxID=1314800 RepID=A0A1B7MYU5_9AGAM|nr:HET-domain-containing protein [Rhizopogon vinicolor AM-OR11-026]
MNGGKGVTVSHSASSSKIEPASGGKRVTVSHVNQTYLPSSGKIEPGSIAYMTSIKDGAPLYRLFRAFPASDQTLPGALVANGVQWVSEEDTQALPEGAQLATAELASSWSGDLMMKRFKKSLQHLTPTTEQFMKQPTKHISQPSGENALGYHDAPSGTAGYDTYRSDVADLRHRFEVDRNDADRSPVYYGSPAPRTLPVYSSPPPMYTSAPGYPTYGGNSPYMHNWNHYGPPAPDGVYNSAPPVMYTSPVGYGGNNPYYNQNQVAALPFMPPNNFSTFQNGYPIPPAVPGSIQHYGPVTYTFRPDKLSSAAPDPYYTTDTTVLASRCQAKLEQMLWDDALVDAQIVTELNPSSYLGYELKHAALHGAQRYDEAIEDFDTMLSKLKVSDTEHRQQYISSSKAASAIQDVISAHLANIPHRLLHTSTGLLCNRKEQKDAFKDSAEYKELLSSTMKHADSRRERIEKAVLAYFSYVMLSHKWDDNELRLRDIQDKNVYECNLVIVAKVQSFCKTARRSGYLWAWVDTCCIDQDNNVEVQHSVQSMFIWYRRSALTIIYLSDVPPFSRSVSLAKCVWNERGWTVQEFLAPKVVLFYYNDWTRYLSDQSPNHKESHRIMQELGDATGIDGQALISFQPGIGGAREKLQWVSRRKTTQEEDIAYSLFGIFGVNLPVIYGEMKQNALGRLLQEIVAKSGEISALDWVGKSSEFNSCLPLDTASYATPPCMLSSLHSEDEMQRSVSSLRNAGAVDFASKLYHKLSHLNPPRFANQRLHLPCIAFHVTEVKRKRSTQDSGSDQKTRPMFTVTLKADGLHDLSITMEDKLAPYSRAKPSSQPLLLVRPWDRSLIELPHVSDDISDTDSESGEDVHDISDTDSESGKNKFPPTPPSPGGCHEENGLPVIDSHLRELKLMVCLEQRFSAFLLAQQRFGEYKRIVSDQNIIAQTKDMQASLHNVMDVQVTTVEIL